MTAERQANKSGMVQTALNTLDGRSTTSQKLVAAAILVRHAPDAIRQDINHYVSLALYHKDLPESRQLLRAVEETEI